MEERRVFFSNFLFSRQKMYVQVLFAEGFQSFLYCKAIKIYSYWRYGIVIQLKNKPAFAMFFYFTFILLQLRLPFFFFLQFLYLFLIVWQNVILDKLINFFVEVQLETIYYSSGSCRTGIKLNFELSNLKIFNDYFDPFEVKTNLYYFWIHLKP